MRERLRAPSPFPPLGTAFSRGAAAILGSFTLLSGSLLLVGLLWLGLVGVGMETFPRAMVEALAIPPVGTYFDVLAGANIYGLTSSALGITLALTVIRSIVWAMLVGLILERLEYGLVTVVGVLQGLRALPAILMVNTVNLVLIVAGNVILPTLLGAIGNLVFIATLVGGLYLLAFAPAAAIRLRLPGREAMRRSGRAARMPGPRHVVMVTIYFFIALMLATFVPGGATVTANPTAATWAFVLAGSVLHLVFLAAFCSQWIAVEDKVPASPPPRQRPTARTRR
jgi:hypothetical protein